MLNFKKANSSHFTQNEIHFEHRTNLNMAFSCHAELKKANSSRFSTKCNFALCERK